MEVKRVLTSVLDRVLPLAVGFDELDEFGVGFFEGDIFLHAVFADVEIDFAGRASDISKIRVGHLAGAVHDTAHDGDFDAF